MKLLATLTLLATISAPSSSASAAGGLLLTLPKDGSWTQYDVEMKSDRPVQEMSGTFTLRSVGSVTENGEKCRWIEMQMERKQNGKKQERIFKFLVKEKDFKPGSNGGWEIIRGWKQNKSDGAVEELTDKDKSADGMMAVFFTGNRKAVKKSKTEKVIDYRKGQLRISTRTTRKMELKPNANAPANSKIGVAQSVWPHKDVPFGTAEMELQMEFKIKDMVASKRNVTFSLRDHGNGGKEAKSVLPDKK